MADTGQKGRERRKEIYTQVNFDEFGILPGAIVSCVVVGGVLQLPLVTMCSAFHQKATTVARATQTYPSITIAVRVPKDGSRCVKTNILKFLKLFITYSSSYSHVHRNFFRLEGTG
jgi:hypothetical protein